MSLQTTKYLNVDFYDKKYILINAKQYDKSSRFLEVTCYNQGEVYPINAGEHSAYIRYKKPDNNSVFNFCEIDRKGKIRVELTEQMLASSGISYVDLVIVNKGDANVDVNTGEITTIDNASILSTMVFCIDVSESAVENTEIESSYEYDGLNDLLERAEADYSNVVRLARSYAIGNAGGIRENEDIDNAKYYYKNSLINMDNTKTYMNNAETYMNNAKISEERALASVTNAQKHMNNAETYMNNAKISETNAKTSETNAKTSEKQISRYASNAEDSMESAISSATSASESAANAYNYYLQTEAITNGLNGAFLPMGTIEFSELATLKDGDTIAAGYLYNISDNFITDETFRMGAGAEYSAGTNVYYTADGYWDCLAGATVTGVKGVNETIYRKGNVDITAENVGAISTTDIATIDEMKNYLGI